LAKFDVVIDAAGGMMPDPSCPLVRPGERPVKLIAPSSRRDADPEHPRGFLREGIGKWRR
jgi:hypothetical protein